jgi:4-hydroxy-3-methylbut-2-enyl diphosphate reductase
VIERVVLVSPRGFCAGVVRAIATVERALAIFPPPVYVRRAIVHNAHVVAGLAAAGAIFVDDLDNVPRGAVVVFSAHGVPAWVREQAKARGLRVVDATCPLVAKVHREVRRFRGEGFDVVLIGQARHDEVVGTLGQAPGVRLVARASDVPQLRVSDPDRVACVTQTTLSPHDLEPVIDALRRRFPAMVEPSSADVCFATRNRQAAVSRLARDVDVVIVVGDPTSANSRHLRDTVCAAGTPAYLVGTADELEDAWFAQAKVVGVSAGASTPEDLVVEVVDRLCRDRAALEHAAHLDEQLSFRLPRQLAAADGDRASIGGRKNAETRREEPEKREHRGEDRDRPEQLHDDARHIPSPRTRLPQPGPRMM